MHYDSRHLRPQYKFAKPGYEKLDDDDIRNLPTILDGMKRGDTIHLTSQYIIISSDLPKEKVLGLMSSLDYTAAEISF